MKTTNLKKLSIYDIKRLTSETEPYFFSHSTMKFFKQTLKDFRVIRLFKEGKYLIIANNKLTGFYTQRKFNPNNNKLEFC